MAVVSGMFIKSVFDVIRIDDASYKKGVRTALEKLMRRGAKLWLLEVTSRIPYRTGFLLGAFSNLEDALGIQLEGKTNPLIDGVRKVTQRTSKTNTERVASLLKSKARLRQIETDIEGSKTKLGAFESLGSKPPEKSTTATQRAANAAQRQAERERLAAEGLSYGNKYRKSPAARGEDAYEQSERYQTSKARQAEEKRLKALEAKRILILKRIQKQEAALLRRKSKVNSKRSRGKIRGVNRTQAGKMALLAALSQLAQRQFKGRVPAYIPKANRRDVTGATTDRIVKVRKKKYKYVLVEEERETEAPNPEYTKLSQVQKVKLAAKKQLPPKTIKTITKVPVHKKVFDRYVVKKKKINETKRSSHIDVFREYYYHTKGSKARVLKTPKTGSQFATPKEEIFSDFSHLGSSGETIAPLQGIDVATSGKSFQSPGDKPFTPSSQLSVARNNQSGRGKTTFEFAYSVDIKYWRIMDLYKNISRGGKNYSPRGTPWLSLVNANKKMLDYIRAELEKPGTLPTMFDYLVKSKSSVIVGRNAVVRGTT